MPRPPVPIPLWAFDPTYVSPGKVWDGADTKIPPTLSQIAQGFLPSERPPAEFFNYVLQAIAAHLVHQDGIEVQNWSPAISAAGLANNQPFTVQRTMAWNPFTRELWIVGGGGAHGYAARSFEGTFWTDSGDITFGELSTIAVNETTGFMMIGEGITTSGHYYVHDPADPIGTWTTVSPIGTRAWTSFWDSAQDRFVLLGQNTGTNHPAIWTTDGTGAVGTFTAATVGGSGGYTGVIYLVATSGSIHLAIGTTAPFPAVFTEHSWTNSDLTQPWVDQGPLLASGGGPLAHTPAGLAYDASRGVFVVVCIGGEVYISPDGIAWTQVHALDATLTFQNYTLETWGAIYAAVAETGAARVMVWSVDGGQNWNRVPWPAPITEDPAGLILADDRLMLLHKDSGSGAGFSYSLRLR